MLIDDLPTELLIEVFDNTRAGAAFAPDSGSTAIVPISQVCARWRSVALGANTLWDDLRISAQTKPEYTSNLLARSKDSKSLCFCIDIAAGGTVLELSALSQILKQLIAHRARVSSLSVRGPQFVLNLLSHAVMHGSADFPVLQHLHIEDGDVSPGRVALWKYSIECPTLHSLCLVGLLAVPSPDLHESNAMSLRELVIKEGCFASDCMDGWTPIALYPNLRVLDIQSSALPSSSSPRNRPGESPIVSLTLAYLRHVDVPPHALAEFLSGLGKMALQSLHVAGLSWYLWDELLEWLATLVSLRSLTLEDVQVDKLEIHHLSCLSRLRLLDVSSEPIVRMLEENPDMCPELREIDVDGQPISR
ncbi:hypothetical protein C8F01DRAFT_1274512 [Mycena amicta]|nr:hypothetical protein C8F01DRAFT_1274512 [Mycena amicta]